METNNETLTREDNTMQSRIRDEFDECSPSDMGILDWSEVAFTPDEDDEREGRLVWFVGAVMVALVFWAAVAGVVVMWGGE